MFHTLFFLFLFLFSLLSINLPGISTLETGRKLDSHSNYPLDQQSQPQHQLHGRSLRRHVEELYNDLHDEFLTRKKKSNEKENEKEMEMTMNPIKVTTEGDVNILSAVMNMDEEEENIESGDINKQRNSKIIESPGDSVNMMKPVEGVDQFMIPPN